MTFHPDDAHLEPDVRRERDIYEDNVVQFISSCPNLNGSFAAFENQEDISASNGALAGIVRRNIKYGLLLKRIIRTIIGLVYNRVPRTLQKPYVSIRFSDEK